VGAITCFSELDAVSVSHFALEPKICFMFNPSDRRSSVSPQQLRGCGEVAAIADTFSKRTPFPPEHNRSATFRLLVISPGSREGFHDCSFFLRERSCGLLSAIAFTWFFDPFHNH
jgi:hypothetical protein